MNDFEKALTRYHELVDLKYLRGLTETEAEEMQRLGEVIDAEFASFYQATIDSLCPHS